MFAETSRVSLSSSQYSSPEAKRLDGPHESGAVVVRAHSGWRLLRHWIHFAAILVTGGLATINFLNVYLMDLDHADTVPILNAFQFAAKFHEVLIVGSLMLILMDTVRSRLLSSSGVPFGQLLAPILFNDLDWLVSHQFWSSLKPRRGTYFLTTLISMSVPFANIAGPLSAIVVVPRLGFSSPEAAAVFPTFWNTSANNIWPAEFAATDLAPACFTSAAQRAGCPGSAFKNVWITYDPMFTNGVLCTTLGSFVSCNATIGSNGIRSISVEYDVNSLTTFSTTPTDVIFETIGKRFTDGLALPLNIDGTTIIDAQKVELIDANFVGNLAMKKPIIATTCEDLDYAQLYQTFTDFKLTSNWSAPTVQWLGDIGDSQTPSFLFTYMKNDSILNAATPCQGQECYAAVRCTTNAKWVPMSIWYSSAQAGIVFQSDPQPRKLFERATTRQAQPVTVKKTWLDTFNVPIQIDVSSVFVDFMNHWKVPMVSTGRVVGKSGSQAPPNPTNYSQAVSILVSSIITEGMARQSLSVGDSLYNGNCSDRKPGFEFARKICDQDPSFWVHADSLGGLNDFSMMSFSVRRSGYGWFIDSLTVKISLGVLLLHGLLILVYVTGTLIFRRTITTCWSSAPEMLMLAVDSLRSPVLMGSSARAAHRDLWNEPVSVMEVDDGERVSLIVGEPFSYPDRLVGPPQLGKKYS